jgi:hypothetical protein
MFYAPSDRNIIASYVVRLLGGDCKKVSALGQLSPLSSYEYDYVTAINIKY